MREILSDVIQWQMNGERIAIATVTWMKGSAPRRPGARMAISESGKISGSVSGGCVEAAVIETAMEVIKHGKPRLLDFGISVEDNIAQIGLACGGTIKVFIERLETSTPSQKGQPQNPQHTSLVLSGSIETQNTHPHQETAHIQDKNEAENWFTILRKYLSQEQGIAMATIISGTNHIGQKLLIFPDQSIYGTLNHDHLEHCILADAEQVMWSGTANTYHYQQEEAGEKQAEIQVFLEGFAPSPELIIVGAGHIAIALTSLAKTLQYRVTVIDARSVFATRERFPTADELIHIWPDEALTERELTPATAVALLTHDPKFDEPTLKVLLSRNVGYIGAIGSRKTSQERTQRLRKQGFTEAQLQRIHGPIGLAIGAVSPEEIALAIMAEIVATRHGKLLQSAL